jgi:aminoglycoside phosphotransferase family enzyme/predicted kinase
VNLTEQVRTIAFLSDPATHGLVGQVERMETHISYIFLAGGRVYKVKRAVKLPYVDFSTPELRHEACRKEVELNRRTAPGLYIGVRRITGAEADRVEFDGKGPLVDAAVEMVRFEQDRLFDRMAARGELTPQLMTRLAGAIAAFHRDAPIVRGSGGAANMAAVLDINEAGFATSDVFSSAELKRFAAAFRRALSHHAALMDSRERAGMVRRCHGDLHLRNICLFHGEPRLFDCIEFNDAIATVDTLYDLAFLLMDLWHRDLRDLANLTANRYLDETGDDEGFVLLPFFMAVRAAVRAHVTATQVAEGAGNPGEARSYFDLALSLLKSTGPKLVAIGGLSGSGKTTVAEALAGNIGAPPGARIIESDRIRKALYGVSAETRLPKDAYKAGVSERVYAEMARRAGAILESGGTVLADAVFERRTDRDLMERAARGSGVPFLGVWLGADAQTLRGRVSARRGGPSDATVEILQRQLRHMADYSGWTRVDAKSAPKEVAACIIRLAEISPSAFAAADHDRGR